MAYFCNTLLCHYHTAQCRKSYQSQHNNINYCPFIWSCSSVSLYHPVLLLTTSLVLLARASSSSTSSWTHLQTNRNFTRKNIIINLFFSCNEPATSRAAFVKSFLNFHAPSLLPKHLPHIFISISQCSTAESLSRNSWVRGFISPAASPAANISHSPFCKNFNESNFHRLHDNNK